MSPYMTPCICAITAFGLALSLTNVAAQQAQLISFKTPADNSNYTEQHVIDVGDVPGHHVRWSWSTALARI
jgi:hypothetical protein